MDSSSHDNMSFLEHLEELRWHIIRSLIAIISAYFIEYILGHQPCNLCLIERIPYALSIIMILFYHIFKRDLKFIILLIKTKMKFYLLRLLIT